MHRERDALMPCDSTLFCSLPGPPSELGDELHVAPPNFPLGGLFLCVHAGVASMPAFQQAHVESYQNSWRKPPCIPQNRPRPIALAHTCQQGSMRHEALGAGRIEEG